MTDKVFHPLEDAGVTAEAYAPLLLSLFRPTSVIDFGCNVGCWLKIFLDAGITDILGVDGTNMVDHLRFPKDRFVAHDLCEPFDACRKFDLAICLEVGEHLPASAADVLVDTVTRHADMVFWSAATPGQGGYEHVNEQEHEYWVEKFERRGYVSRPMFDILPVAPHDYYRKNAWAFRKS